LWRHDANAQTTKYSRLTSQNHHHITVSTIESQVIQICRDQRRQESDVHAIQEHKLDHNKYVVRAAFTKATKQIHRTHRIEIGGSALKTITTYKPGGTALIAQGDITGRIQTQDSDPYGRWSYITFNGSPSKSIIIISAYQVCTKPTNQTGITAYHQQETAFNHERRNNSNPRYNFKHDLTKFIKHQQRRGTQVNLLGDFNEHVDSHKAAIHHIRNQCTLIDIWKRQHPSSDEPNTYLCGRTRIDYALISPALETAITAVGY
jgi:exonuclease III